VAGDDDRDWVCADGPANSPSGRRSTGRPTELAVGGYGAVWQGNKLPPHRLLKRTSAGGNWNLERGALAAKVLGELRGSQVEQSIRVLGEIIGREASASFDSEGRNGGAVASKLDPPDGGLDAPKGAVNGAVNGAVRAAWRWRADPHRDRLDGCG